MSSAAAAARGSEMVTLVPRPGVLAMLISPRACLTKP
jgi:hypothetical protein